MAGHEIETAKGSGWAWPELDLVNPTADGAPRAQRDALKLLAVFIQHTDSKPEQQRLVCVSQSGKERPGEPCDESFMMVHDLGQTFGHANLFNRGSVGSVNLNQWSRAPIWKDPARCVAYLPKSLTGSLSNPPISEAGRRFLADLLAQLTDPQLHDLFDAARVTRRSRIANPAARGATVDDWVAAFKHKRNEITDHVCPASL
jgi:hypothetical protein